MIELFEYINLCQQIFNDMHFICILQNIFESQCELQVWQ